MISGSVEQTERPAGGPAGEEASLDGKRGEKVSDEVGSGQAQSRPTPRCSTPRTVCPALPPQHHPRPHSTILTPQYCLPSHAPTP